MKTIRVNSYFSLVVMGATALLLTLATAQTALACGDGPCPYAEGAEAPVVEVSVANVDDGVQVTRTADDAEIVAHIQERMQARLDDEGFWDNHEGFEDVTIELELLENGVTMTLRSPNADTVAALQSFHAEGGHDFEGGGHGGGHHGRGDDGGRHHGGGHHGGEGHAGCGAHGEGGEAGTCEHHGESGCGGDCPHQGGDSSE